MTIKEAFEYLSSECGIGMKNPFIALRNLVEAFGKVADEIDPTPSGDFVKKSGDTMTGPLSLPNSDLNAGWVYSTAYSFKGTELGGQVDLVSRATLGDPVQIEVPQKNGTMALKNDIESYSTDEKWVGSWIDGSKLYQKTYVIDALPSAAGYQDISLEMSNIDVKHSFGDLKWASGSTRPFGAVGLDRNSPATWYTANQITYSIEENSFIRITVGADRSSVSATITIQYIKIT